MSRDEIAKQLRGSRKDVQSAAKAIQEQFQQIRNGGTFRVALYALHYEVHILRQLCCALQDNLHKHADIYCNIAASMMPYVEPCITKPDFWICHLTSLQYIHHSLCREHTMAECKKFYALVNSQCCQLQNKSNYKFYMRLHIKHLFYFSQQIRKQITPEHKVEIFQAVQGLGRLFQAMLDQRHCPTQFISELNEILCNRSNGFLKILGASSMEHINHFFESLFLLLCVDPKWKVDTPDRETRLAKTAGLQVLADGDVDYYTEHVARCVKSACNAAMVVARTSRGSRKPVLWWNSGIGDARKECHRARRISQRARKKHNFEELQEEFRQRRRILKNAIKSSKVETWGRLCAEAKVLPFGIAYKIGLGKFLKCPTPPDEAQLYSIVNALFPARTRARSRVFTVHDSTSCPINVDKVLGALAMVKTNKASGPDGVSIRMLKTIIGAHSEAYTDFFNKCMREGRFPRRWKQQRLVLIPKRGRSAEDPSTYRPICLLDVVGNLFESIVCNRLERELEKHGLSGMQLGLRRKRSTVDAKEGTRWCNGGKDYCLITTLDVKNAFNSANWDYMLGELPDLQISVSLIADSHHSS